MSLFGIAGLGGGTSAGQGAINTGMGYGGQAGNIWGGLAGAGGTIQGQFNPVQNSFLNYSNQYTNALTSMPTQQQQAQALSSMDLPAINAYQAASAQLKQNAALSGLQGAGSQGYQSSTFGGGLNSLSMGLANMEASNATNYYNANLSRQAQIANLGAAAQYEGGLAGNLYNEWSGLEGQAAQGDQGLASYYAGVGNDENQEQNEQNSLWGGLIGDAGQGLGGLIGSGFNSGGGGGGSGIDDIDGTESLMGVKAWPSGPSDGGLENPGSNGSYGASLFGTPAPPTYHTLGGLNPSHPIE